MLRQHYYKSATVDQKIAEVITNNYKQFEDRLSKRKNKKAGHLHEGEGKEKVSEEGSPEASQMDKSEDSHKDNL